MNNDKGVLEGSIPALGSCRKPCSQDSKCWMDRRASSGCRKHLGAAVAGPQGHICTLGPQFLDSAWTLPHESPMSRAPHPGQHVIVSAESPWGQSPDQPWLLQRGQQRCHVSRGLQSGASSCIGPPTWLGRHACSQGLTHCLQFFASLSHQSWEILSVLQREIDDHSRVCLG